MPPSTSTTSRTRHRALIAAVGLLALVAATACQPTPTTSTGPPALSIARAWCATGSTITVSPTIVDDVQHLLDAAATRGLKLCGGGYRDSAAQIALRRRNCGTSHYAIWEMPSSHCSPPTAIPGRSMHEKGLAVDFANCSSRHSSCHVWLKANAATYGLYNLPSEPWHWSTNGH